MKVNVVKKLEKKRETSRKDSESILKEVQLLLETDTQAERNALRVVGIDSHVAHVENQRGVEIERQEFEKTYEGHVFTRDEIKDLCMKYDLRFLETRHFIGKIDTVLGPKLKHFIEARKHEIGNYSQDFFIMAPEDAFQLEDMPRKPPRNIDPVLLYRIPRTDKFVFVHKWGKDFTFWRRFRGIFFKSVMNMKLITWAASYLICATALPMVVPTYVGMTVDLLFHLFIAGVAIGVAHLALLIGFNDDSNWGRRTTESRWNTNLRRRY